MRFAGTTLALVASPPSTWAPEGRSPPDRVAAPMGDSVVRPVAVTTTRSTSGGSDSAPLASGTDTSKATARNQAFAGVPTLAIFIPLPVCAGATMQTWTAHADRRRSRGERDHPGTKSEVTRPAKSANGR